jgi:hypothetical protein
MLNEKKEWDKISKTRGLSEEFIRENADKVDMLFISRYQKLSENFIRRHSDKVDWEYISQHQNLSEFFIREFSNEVDWDGISKFQKLSEKFIREFSPKINWCYISAFQKLSADFIREFSYTVDWTNISRYQKLSPEFIKEYSLQIPNYCWLYKDKNLKREFILRYTQYEIIGDKVIAYKTCRADGYSCYNFQYHYETGKEYEAHANYNINEENSFGLSAWTKEKALNYYHDGKLFKIEIDLEDIAAIVNDGNKIRASKIKILEEIKP